MKKIKKINNLEEEEIVILPKKRLLKWFKSIEKEN